MTVKKIKPVEASLFSYRVGNSIIHKIPAGIKLAILFALCISMANKFSENWILLFSYCVATLVVFVAARTPVSHLKNLKFVIFVGLFVTAFRTFEFNQKIAFNLAETKIGLLYTVRLLIAATAALIVFETTSRREIQEVFAVAERGLQKIFPPAKKIPFALTISVAISFIPEIFSVWNAVQLAARARTPSGKIPFSRRIAISIAQISALFSCMFFRAEETRNAIVNRKNL